MKRSLLVPVLVLVLSQAASAFTINGYYENDPMLIFKKDGSSLAGDMNRFRLKIDLRPSSWSLLHVEPRYYFFAKSADIPLLSGVSDLDSVVLDKLFFKASFSSFSVTAGKQRIAWGTGSLWNPTDIFNPFVLSFAVREEDETNTEAVRVEVPMGIAGGIDCYAVVDEPWTYAPRGIRARGHGGLFDFSASYVDRGSNGKQAGGDFSGELLGLGVKGEAAFITPAAGNSYAQWVLGADYTLEDGLGIVTEYFNNGAGTADPSSYNWASGSGQLGKDYLFVMLAKTLDEITSVAGSVIMNLNDKSFMLYPQYKRNVTQNLDVSLESMLLFGDEGSEFNPAAAQDPAGFGGSKMLIMRATYSF